MVGMGVRVMVAVRMALIMGMAVVAVMEMVPVVFVAVVIVSVVAVRMVMIMPVSVFLRTPQNTLHVVVVAFLRQADLGFKAQDLLAVFAHLAVHQVLAGQN